MEKKAKIYYFSLEDEQTKTEKLEWFKNTKLQDIDFQLIKPDKNANWINLADENNGFDDLILVCSKDVKSGKSKDAIFELYSLGVVSNRDEWVYDFDKGNLEKKVSFFYAFYNKTLQEKQGKEFLDDDLEQTIKWTRDLKKHLRKNKKMAADAKKIVVSHFRPFIKQYYYFSSDMNEMLYRMPSIYDGENICISVKGVGMSHPFHILATKYIPHLQFTPNGQCLPLYRYSNGERVENITDWALALFREHYSRSSTLATVEDLDNRTVMNTKQPLSRSSTIDKVSDAKVSEITKLDIFHYVYAVLHKPEYRTTYEQNLKREFPRIPLYADFWKYAEAGRKLMELHLNYELEITNYEPLLERKDIDLEGFKAKKAGKKKKTEDTDKEVAEVDTAFTVYPILKIKDGNIEIDELTTLCGVPAQALAYKLGNRSAIEWILDQYKPYKSDDKTIQEQFNNYNFADYKEQVIELLQKVCWLSVETMKIVGEL
jgi:predicted helicase